MSLGRLETHGCFSALHIRGSAWERFLRFALLPPREASGPTGLPLRHSEGRLASSCFLLQRIPLGSPACCCVHGASHEVSARFIAFGRHTQRDDNILSNFDLGTGNKANGALIMSLIKIWSGDSALWETGSGTLFITAREPLGRTSFHLTTSTENNKRQAALVVTWDYGCDTLS